MSRRRERGPPPRRGRPFRPEDRCYTCGERGHYARDCHRYSRSRRRYVSRYKYLLSSLHNCIISSYLNMFDI